MADVAIIGAGPAGLATAAMLRATGASVRVLDRAGAIGGAYGRMDPTLVMTSPTRLVGLPGLAPPIDGPYATAGAYHAYLVDYAAAHAVTPEVGEVTAVVAAGAAYELAVAGGGARATVERIAARAVVVATGMFDFPVVPVLAGAATVPVIHAAAWRADLAVPGRRVVVVGGASSAIEIAELCARRGACVTVAARRISATPATILGVDPAFALFPLLARVRPRRWCARGQTVPAADRGFAELRRRGAITVRADLTRLDGARATFADGTRADVDLVVLATGYRFASAFLPATVARWPRGTPRCDRNLSASHPGLFFVGSPCARSAASQYLYGIARDAAAVAPAIARWLRTSR
ncbi:MAG: NAD(P)/FAD-dependent oxidoreductase [Myxococcales bacterium]|nr:NAD(P)/FAD-dependent oxidoreductase [Myxococcales bacterium]